MLTVKNIDTDYLAAGNIETSPQKLDELSNADSVRIRVRVAENKNACLSTLFRLFFDNDPEVRLAVAENPSSPQFFLDYLVDDPDDDVRYNLAENANLKLKHLKQLAQDQNPYIRERAKKTIKSKFRVCGDIGGFKKAC